MSSTSKNQHINDSKRELAVFYYQEFIKKIADFKAAGFEEFVNNRLYPDSDFTASKVVYIENAKAYYLHIEANKLKLIDSPYIFTAIAQFKLLDSFECFNVTLLEVVNPEQCEKFFTNVWLTMKCRNSGI